MPVEKNHTGSAGRMAAAGIVEAFELAPQKFGCFYLRYVGDGDSSVADSIVCNVSMQQHVHQKTVSHLFFQAYP